MDWAELLKHPVGGDHIVQTWQDEGFLGETVAEYIGSGLRGGDAGLIVATPAHADLFKRNLRAARAGGPDSQLRFLDAEDTLGKFMQSGMPDWNSFHQVVGGLIAEIRLQYPAVRVYGEMVDVLASATRRSASRSSGTSSPSCRPSRCSAPIAWTTWTRPPTAERSNASAMCTRT
jgi:hypothetical protein